MRATTRASTRIPIAAATALVLSLALLASCSKGTESPDAASTAGNANPIVVLKTTRIRLEGKATVVGAQTHRNSYSGVLSRRGG
jgi:hypothetical protein